MKVANTNNVLGHLDAGELIKSQGEAGALKTVSAQFEAHFLQTVLKQMRSASDAIADKDNVLSSQQGGMYRDWYDNQLASNLSAHQSIGLADVMTRQLSAGMTQNVSTPSVETMAMRPALIIPHVKVSK